MNIFESIFLGIVQGITEFLPISSSGHLVILQNIMNIQSEGVFFEVALHFGTLISIFLVYHYDFKQMFIESIKFFKKFRGKKMSSLTEYESLVLFIIVGSIPTAFMGFAFEETFEKMFDSPYIVGIMLLITGSFLMISRKMTRLHKNFRQMAIVDALIIGTFQGFAISPGISRAGSTIFASLMRGLKREKAVKYSFLLSVPAVLGANLLKLKDINSIDISLSVLIAGVIASVVSGYFAIKLLTKILNRGKLYLFAYYCWILGSIIILINAL